MSTSEIRVALDQTSFVVEFEDCPNNAKLSHKANTVHVLSLLAPRHVAKKMATQIIGGLHILRSNQVTHSPSCVRATWRLNRPVRCRKEP